MIDVSLSDTIGVTDDLQTAAVYARNLADSASVTDSLGFRVFGASTTPPNVLNVDDISNVLDTP
ncbi:hypothetical protein LCGC14_0724250 [marine sediment metagenome]|uniref:Uncharacterized protein n=1 Tax=marine sediment metagenome TaxID=412755 RepID=A0A0F9TIT4_9ZZZZ